MPVPISDLQQPAPSAIIELFEIELIAAIHGSSDVYRFHNGTNVKDNGLIRWAGNGYVRMPIEADGFEYSGTGLLPRPSIRVSNLFGTITTILLSLPNGLEGAKLTRIRTLARYLDADNFPENVNPYGTPDPTVEFPREVYFISQKITEDRDIVEFQCAAAFDLAGVRLPRRQAIVNVCQWRYRGPECGYTGSTYFTINDDIAPTLGTDVCGKRLRSCEYRFAAIATTGAVTQGSPSLVVAAGDGINVGDSINGFGIPAGTTVQSRSGNTITMTQNANATSTVSGRTGTFSSDGLTLNVSSAAGLGVGMTVTGNFVPNNARISSISGNALRLNIEVNSNFQILSQTRTVQFALKTVNFKRGIKQEDLDARELLVIGGLSGINVSDLVQGEAIYSGTTVSEKKSNGNIRLSKDGRTKFVKNEFGVNVPPTFTATFLSGRSPTAESYSFSGPNRYVFRQGGVVPFGSFPGVGGAY